MYKAIEFEEQVVAGTNYRIKVTNLFIKSVLQTIQISDKTFNLQLKELFTVL